MLDLAKQRGNDVQVGLIEENIQSNPEMRIFPMRQIAAIAYKTLIRTGYPTAGFRHANEGVARSKSTFENRLVECYIMDSQIAADKAIADAWDPGGFAAYQMIEAAGVLEAVTRTVSRQIYYGNSPAAVAQVASSAKGFPGFVDAYDATDHMVDATGASALSSVWAVRLGIKDVHLIAGGGGLPNILPEWRVQSIGLDDNSTFTAYVNSLMGWIGMQVGAVHSLVRIKNIGTAAGKTMTDDLGSQAIEKFPSGLVPDYFIMNRRTRRQLQESRQAVAAAGGFQASTVPTPTDIEGIPILCTDAISNDEGSL